MQRSAFWQALINRESQVLINAASVVQNIATSLITKVTYGDPGGQAAGYGQRCVSLGEFINLFWHTARKQRQIKSYVMPSAVLAGEMSLLHVPLAYR